MRSGRAVIFVATALLGCAGLAAHAADTSYSEIAKGKALVDAGDCAGCHTAEKSKPFAGGRSIPTPFGMIEAPNITPDVGTGIGGWSEEDFYNALHFGKRPDGSPLYPAFPYPYYTKLTREDVRAIYAYLQTIPPVKNEAHQNRLMWPLNYRFFMHGWDWVFFDAGEYRPNTQKSPQWNRGAYLVEGAGHCGACHTPKNALGGDETSKYLLGGVIQNWFAPTIANNMQNGTGGWSEDDIVEYLKTGRNRFSGATGPMAEVIEYSTSKMADGDLHAIAVYLKDVSGGTTASVSPPDDKTMNAGKAIYADSCSGCHQAEGKGIPRMFPPLAGNANVKSSDPTTVIRVILEGARTVPTDPRPTASTMPAYGWKLDDKQVAAVATYVRNAWGNAAPAVSADQVAKMRKILHEEHAGGS